MYRCEAKTVEGFVQQLAVAYIARGCWFHVVGRIPAAKDPVAVDRKLIERYSIDVSKWARARRKRAGLANMHYLRHGRLFVLLATHGEHRFFADEAGAVRDARRTPIRCFGYSVSSRGGHAHVRISADEYNRFKALMLDLAPHRSTEELEGRLHSVPFEPYAPVRRQLLNIWRAVNRVRLTAGLEPLRIECLRLRRRIVRPFDEPGALRRGREAMRPSPQVVVPISCEGDHAENDVGCGGKEVGQVQAELPIERIDSEPELEAAGTDHHEGGAQHSAEGLLPGPSPDGVMPAGVA